MSDFTKEIQDKILHYLESAESFTKEHAPDICQQYIKTRYVEYTIELATSFILLLITTIVSIFIFKYTDNSNDNKDLILIFTTIIFCIVMPICFIWTMETITNLINIIIAPKLILLEYFRKGCKK